LHIEEHLTAKGFTPAAQVPQVYGGPRIVDGIICHHWGNDGQTHDGVNNFFVNGPGNTSAHYVVSDGRWTCLVSPWDAAWHAGNGEGNRTKIGIEMRPEATEGDYRAAAQLIAHLRAQFQHPLPLSPHRQWQATACPGRWDLAKLDAMARGEAAPAPSVTPQSAPAAVADQCIVEAGDTLSAIAAQFGVNLDALIAVNGITEPDKIFPGMVLDLPASQCIVDPGDTLTSIARQFGVSVDRIISVNPGIDPNRIKPGQVLNL
jgi:N-acetylmuramoyl-L-alanine amidase